MKAVAESEIFIYESGSDVAVSGEGTVDLSGLSLEAPFGAGPIAFLVNGLDASGGESPGVSVGSPGGGVLFYCVAAGPASFGSGSLATTSVGSGDQWGLYGIPIGATGVAPGTICLLLPNGYTSGAFLSGTATYENTDLTALGLTIGEYVYTWGSDKLTLIVGARPGPVAPGPVAPVPTLPFYALLALTGLLGLFGLRKLKK
ncbi:hypothetical protein EYC87_08325 [Halieaceae bacterium IMCC8485]|uniref:IPTL-CTERM protein sorting domain-containing protein n=1 Tax=Candidatus Seongchinamella marina TaxID=2518990 RepID=A0ABT3SUB3_9GAMM|nr:hypothetical protein [Candidatus Seongchinamella marina]MCX2973583.1 hypothetical protein [Candidatus Seongchinamella marina]